MRRFYKAEIKIKMLEMETQKQKLAHSNKSLLTHNS